MSQKIDCFRNLKDTVLRSTPFNKGFVAVRTEFCDFEDSREIRRWFDLVGSRLEESSYLELCFEI